MPHPTQRNATQPTNPISTTHNHLLNPQIHPPTRRRRNRIKLPQRPVPIPPNRLIAIQLHEALSNTQERLTTRTTSLYQPNRFCSSSINPITPSLTRERGRGGKGRERENSLHITIRPPLNPRLINPDLRPAHRNIKRERRSHPLRIQIPIPIPSPSPSRRNTPIPLLTHKPHKLPLRLRTTALDPPRDRLITQIESHSAVRDRDYITIQFESVRSVGRILLDRCIDAYVCWEKLTMSRRRENDLRLVLQIPHFEPRSWSCLTLRSSYHQPKQAGQNPKTKTHISHLCQNYD